MKQNVKWWFGILLGMALMVGLMVGLSATVYQMIRLIAFPFLCALMAWITLLLGR